MALSQNSKILVSDITSALAGKQDALGFAPVKSVNGSTPDTNGNVTISATPTTVKGEIGSAIAENSRSLTLPSGGTWFVWNTYTQEYYSQSGESNLSFGVGTSNSLANKTGYQAYGGTFSGGTTVYAKNAGGGNNNGKLAAIRIA